MPLQELFTQFWKFAEEETVTGTLTSKPLLRVRENWNYWWEGGLSAEQRQEIEQLVAGMSDAAQESFIQWVKGWIRQRFQRAGAVRLVLMQLAHVPLFQGWGCLEPHRLENLKGVNAFILQHEGGGWSEDVKPLAVMLIPKEAKDDIYCAPIELKVSDVFLESARNAALSLLCGVGLVLLLAVWGLTGRKPRRWWRPILSGGWALVFGILCFLLIAVPPADAVLVPALWTMLAIMSAMFLCAIYSNGREVLHHGRKWARLQRRSQLCVLVGGIRGGSPLDVRGPSFEVALCLAILLALHEEDPVGAEQSWLWGPLFDRLAEGLPRWAFTGALRGSGWLERVGRVAYKRTASLDHPDITDMVMPAQKEDRQEDRPRVVQRTTPVTPLSTCAGRDASELRLHYCRHMAQVLLVMGGLASAWEIGARTVLALSLVVAVAALPDIRWIILPPDPEFDFKECWMEGSHLQLSIKTDYPEHFKATLTSPFWANREQQFYRRPQEPHRGFVTIELVRLTDAEGHVFAGEVQVVYPRKLLFLRLPEVVVRWDSLEHVIKRGGKK